MSDERCDDFCTSANPCPTHAPMSDERTPTADIVYRTLTRIVAQGESAAYWQKVAEAVAADLEAEAAQRSTADLIPKSEALALAAWSQGQNEQKIEGLTAEVERLRAVEAIARRLVTAYEQFEGSHWNDEEVAYRDLKAVLAEPDHDDSEYICDVGPVK